MREPITGLLNALIAAARPRLLAAFPKPDHCIAATAVAVEVLHALDVVAEPLPVRAIVATPDGWSAWKEGRPTTTGHSVGIGFGGPTPGRYVGHLVTLVENRLLLDLTLDQASRPERDMPVSAGWFGPVGDGFLRGELLAVFARSSAPPVVVAYGRVTPPDPAFRSWRSTPDWTGRSAGEVRRLTSDTVRELRPPRHRLQVGAGVTSTAGAGAAR